MMNTSGENLKNTLFPRLPTADGPGVPQKDPQKTVGRRPQSDDEDGRAGGVSIKVIGGNVAVGDGSTILVSAGNS